MATYVHDLCIAAQNPGKIIQTLKEDYKLKVKRDRPLSHHLGAEVKIIYVLVTTVLLQQVPPSFTQP